MENSGERIKRALAIRGMSQAELARATGIPTSGISQYCRGKFRPKQDKIYLMSQVLRVNPAWLMGADVPMEDTKTNVGTKEKLSLSQDSDLNLLNSEETDPELRAIFNNLKNNQMLIQLNRNAIGASDADLQKTIDFMCFLKAKDKKKEAE